MPKDRLQVDSGLGPARLAPVASPVDTYSRTGAGQQLSQLAAGLAQFEPSLARFTNVYSERQNASLLEEGQTAARKIAEQGKTYAQAIKDGLIPRGASPFFVRGFKEQFGRVTADRWSSDLMLAVAKDEKLRTTTNLQDFDSFAQKHLSDWLQQNVDPSNRDADFEMGFGNRSDAYMTDARRQFASELAQRVERFSEDAHFAEVKKHILDNFGKFTPEQIASDINNLNTDVIAHGRDGTTVNQVTTRAVVAAALERAQMGDHNAPQLLKLLEHIQGGSGPLSNTEYATNAGIKVRDDINNLLYQADQRERQTADDYRKDKTRNVLTQAVQTLMQNPYANISGLAGQLEGDPEALGHLVSLQKNAGELKGVITDEEVKSSLFGDIWSDGGTSVQTIVSAMNHRKLSVPDANFLISQINERERLEKEKGSSLFSDPQFRAVDSTFSALMNDPLIIEKADGQQRVRYAQALLRDEWIQYIGGAGATANNDEKNKFLVSAADRIQRSQLQGLLGTMNPAAPPEFKSVEEKLPKAAVMTLPSFQKMTREALNGSLSPESAAILRMYHINGPLEISQFFRIQARLLGVKLGDTGGSEPKPQESSPQSKP